MHAFDQHIGGEQQVIGGTARAEYRAIVADPQHDSGAARDTRALLQALDELDFARVDPPFG
jgi:hypothetical protein